MASSGAVALAALARQGARGLRTAARAQQAGPPATQAAGFPPAPAPGALKEDTSSGLLESLFGGVGSHRVKTPLTDALEGAPAPQPASAPAAPPATLVATLSNGATIASEVSRSPPT